MRNILIMLILITLPASCTEEYIAPEYFIGTVWGITESGGIYENKELLYSYINTHVLSLGSTSFTHYIYRKEAPAGSLGFIDKEVTEMSGTYELHYPNITLKYANKTTDVKGTVEVEMLSLNYEDERKSLEMLRRSGTKTE